MAEIAALVPLLSAGAGLATAAFSGRGGRRSAPAAPKREDRQGENTGFDVANARDRKKRRGRSQSILAEAAGKQTLG